MIIDTISKNSITRELSIAKIAAIVSPFVKGGLSDRSVHRALRRRGYKPVKPTKKPGLIEANKITRLKWCLDYEHWTLDDWKKVIWSNETSVTWGGQRGRIRVWRMSSKAYNYHCICRWWKGFKEFMFWGCFLWYGKGPCYIWYNETVAEKAEAKKWLEEANKKLEPEMKLAWELETAMRRMNITRRLGDTKLVWRWHKATGKLERTASYGGIDWYRYYKVILELKLILFAQRLEANLQLGKKILV